MNRSDLRAQTQQLKAHSLHDLTKSASGHRPDLHIATEGEFEGWRTWTRDRFETFTGPFWHRMEEDGSIRVPDVLRPYMGGIERIAGSTR